MYKYFSIAIWFILVNALYACSSTMIGTEDPGAGTVIRNKITEDSHWWYCRFQIAWPENTEPDMAVDLMLAHAVAGPVLERYEPDIRLWRFHRRAARDAAGHQFSFIYYADTKAAEAIMAALNQSDILQRALSAGILVQISFDDPASPGRPGIADTSDQNWPAAIRKNWPVYIMGVSATWLGLISDAMASQPAATDLTQMLGHYRAANDFISTLWTSEGQHAFLHHLSAVFGYEPVLIRKEIRF